MLVTLLRPLNMRRVRRAADRCLSRLVADGRICPLKQTMMSQMLQAVIFSDPAPGTSGAYRAAARTFGDLGRRIERLPSGRITAHDWAAANSVARFYAEEREW